MQFLEFWPQKVYKNTMIQGLTLGSQVTRPRRTAGLLLAVFLGLAIVPCAMAIEVVEEGHDCCPPELRVDPSECCEIDVGTVRTRGDTFPQDVEPDTVVAAAAYRDLAELAVPRHCATTGPPPAPDSPTDFNKLYCTYLK